MTPPPEAVPSAEARRDGPDWFGRAPDRYARTRPRYPDALFAWLAEQAPGRDRAWDVGTGSGQAAIPLARHVDHVYASDRFPGPLGAAPDVPGVTWALEPAEASSLPDASVDLITVAAAFHWLDGPAFLREVRRVLRPGGLLAVWTYHVTPAHPEVSDVLRSFADDVLHADWQATMPMVLDGYRDVDLGGEPIAAPTFAATTEHDVDTMLELVRTWSAAEIYWRRTGQDPAASLRPTLDAIWTRAVGSPQLPLLLDWPLGLQVRRYPGA